MYVGVSAVQLRLSVDFFLCLKHVYRFNVLIFKSNRANESFSNMLLSYHHNVIFISTYHFFVTSKKRLLLNTYSLYKNSRKFVNNKQGITQKMRSFGRLPRLKHMTCGAAVTSEHCHLFILTMSLAVYLGHMHAYIISCIHSISFIAFEFVYFVIFTSGAFLFFFYRILYLRVKFKSNRSVTYPDLDSICVSSWIRC